MYVGPALCSKPWRGLESSSFCESQSDRISNRPNVVAMHKRLELTSYAKCNPFSFKDMKYTKEFIIYYIEAETEIKKTQGFNLMRNYPNSKLYFKHRDSQESICIMIL